MDRATQLETKKQAREELEAMLGQGRRFWVSCHAGSSGYYYATVWECVRQQDDHDLPVNIGIGIRTDRARALRDAVEDAVERVRYGEREHAEQFIESWVCGNRKYVLGKLRRMPGHVAAAAALTIAAGLPQGERAGFVAAVALAGQVMAPKPEQPESERVCEPG